MIDGASNYYVSATEPGNYSVLITTSYGCTTLSNVVIVTSDIEGIHPDHLILTPNPAVQTTVLQGLKPGAIITLTDTQGRLIRTIQAQQRNQEIQVGDLAPGWYLVQVQDGEHHHPFKLLKQ